VVLEKKQHTPPSEYEIAFHNLRYNPRGYIRKIISLYDSISERLTDKEKGEFYSERENSGLLFHETATIKAITAFDETARPLYDKHFRKLERARYIDFNQGVDARLVTEEKMRKLTEINVRPLRIAFDDLSQKNIYEKAVRLAAKYGIKHLSNYLLYNYEDEPIELYERLKLNVELCEELDVTIYSFPMKYHPIKDPTYFRTRDYLGSHWNRKFIRAIQAVLNSTKGKIGRGKVFFEDAFGRNVEEFEKILWMPETFIIYRQKYDAEYRETLRCRCKENDKEYRICASGNDKTNEWWTLFKKLTPRQRIIAENFIKQNRFFGETVYPKDKKVREVLEYYKVKRD
jgi:hypothetical protein